MWSGVFARYIAGVVEHNLYEYYSVEWLVVFEGQQYCGDAILAERAACDVEG